VKKARGYVPCEGEWKCGTCSFWNNAAWDRCLRGFHNQDGSGCGVSRDDCSAGHEVQCADVGIRPRRTGARWFADWACGFCKYWNRHTDGVCHKCARVQEDCNVGEDLDESLRSWYEPGLVTNGSGDFLRGNEKNPSAGLVSTSAGASTAAFYGTKGRYKQRKNPYTGY
jgi:hypothetical protein